MRKQSFLNDILDKKFRVLDDGFVKVVDYMGNDEAIVQAARVSYGEGTKTVNEDRGLIRYLMRHQHWTPFEMCELKLSVRVPMDCWRQWVRHRSASVNEYSTRYSIAIDSAEVTPPDKWRMQSTNNKQGSEGFFTEEEGNAFSIEEDIVQANAIHAYNRLLNGGVSREQARKLLPLSTYTEAYWKIDLRNLFNFLKLRMDDHAQYEIREYAKVIGEEIVSVWCPLAWDAFCDYVFNATTFSKSECKILMRSIKDLAPIIGLSAREEKEFVEKLKKNGLFDIRSC